MIIAFAVPGEPKGKARPRTVQIAGHASTYTPKETVMYENLVRLYYQQTARGLRLSGPIQAEIVSYSSVPKSTSKKKRALMASKATPEQAAAKFPLESLRKNCRAVFGVSSCVFAGATADLPDGEYTKEDIKARIDAWAAKEVK